MLRCCAILNKTLGNPYVTRNCTGWRDRPLCVGNCNTMNISDALRLFSLDAGASEDDIRAAYKQLAIKWYVISISAYPCQTSLLLLTAEIENYSCSPLAGTQTRIQGETRMTISRTSATHTIFSGKIGGVSVRRAHTVKRKAASTCTRTHNGNALDADTLTCAATIQSDTF